MSLRDGSKKMSKSEVSEFSRITFKDNKDIISQKIKKSKTDTFPIPDKVEELSDRLEAKNLIGIYSALSDKSIKNVLQEFSGKGFSEFKPKLTDLAVTVLEPINNEMSYLSKNTDYIDEILKKGSEKATIIAEKVLSGIKEIIGFINN